MQTERPPTEQPVSSRTSPARGIVLIAAAVVLGLFLLRALEDSSGSDGAVTAPSTTAAPGDETTETTAGEGGESTTTAAQARPPGEVIVRVANASGVEGAAGARTDQLAGAGYQMVDPTNGPEGQQLEATRILFAEGYEAEARALAEAIGAPADGVAAMPAPPPVDPAGAHLVVLVGTDIAEG